MRAFYTSSNGLTANLCEYLYSNTTRLIIRNDTGSVIFSKEFPTWDIAKDALRSCNEDWTNDLTCEHI